MNKVILMGRLTKDPEVRYTQNTNTLVASFSLAVNRRFVRQGEERQADFINVVAVATDLRSKPRWTASLTSHHRFNDLPNVQWFTIFHKKSVSRFRFSNVLFLPLGVWNNLMQ